VGWGEYVDDLVLRLGRDGESADAVAEAIDAAAHAVVRVISASDDELDEGRHARVAAMRIAFARDGVGGSRAAWSPADLPASTLLSEAQRLVAAAHDALRAGRPLDSSAVLLARVRARAQLRAAYEALSREQAERLEAVALT
jgi:hypothetical protein